MSRFYAPKENIQGSQAVIIGEEGHHLIHVMKLRKGDNVIIFDGEGSEYHGNIASADGKSMTVIVDIFRICPAAADNGMRITLAQALPKKRKMDVIVEKATELGVSSIIPLTTSRTIVKPSSAEAEKMVKRWRNIALAASKQCGRALIPEISGITRISDIIREPAKYQKYDLVLFACLSEGTVPLKQAVNGRLFSNTLIFIGPEGDFSPDEIVSARKAGWMMVSLGKRVLKADTAGIFVLSAIAYEEG